MAFQFTIRKLFSGQYGASLAIHLGEIHVASLHKTGNWHERILCSE